MGAFWCCSSGSGSGDDIEDYSTTSTSNSIYTHCLCLRFFFLHLFTGGYGTAFQRVEGHTTSSTHGDNSISSGIST